MRNLLVGRLAALIALSCLVAGCADGGGPQSPPGAAPPPVGIVGSWRPTSIPGYTAPAQYPDALVQAPISFDRQQRLWGTDGCNDFDGSYRVGRDGSFAAKLGAMTEIGCGNVPNGQVTATARRVVVDGEQLTFLGAGGELLGRYQRIASLGRPDVQPGPLATAMIGTWRPLRIAGYQPPPGYRDGLARAPVTFEASGSWRASDGCNLSSGTYVLDAGGRISVTVGPSTLIGCANVPNATALGRAATIQVTGDRLTLRSATGLVLAVYQRVR